VSPALKTEEKKRVAVIPGDGIGKEVIAEAVKVLRAAAHTRQHELVEFDWGTDRYLRDGTTLPDGAVEMLRRDFDAILLGAMGDPRVPSNKPAMDILLGLRFQLDLYANVRPVMLFDRRHTPLRDRTEQDIRLVIIRENTEGHYVGMGGIFKQNTPDEIASQEDINTRKGVERIIRFAFEYARARQLKRVCMSDKSNALRYGHDLWQRVFAEVRSKYSEIESRHLFIDTLAMELVRDPRQFDVIVTCNLFGDIISDLGAALVGGLGMTPSANINPESTSMFEPVHGSAPDIAGKNLASPLAAVLTAAMMCEHFDWQSEATRMNEAVRAAIREGKTTRDLGGTLGTHEVGDWLAKHV
jgi:3-isopropylmalate dehydrogenase